MVVGRYAEPIELRPPNGSDTVVGSIDPVHVNLFKTLSKGHGKSICQLTKYKIRKAK